jgi:hypothetical protein
MIGNNLFMIQMRTACTPQFQYRITRSSGLRLLSGRPVVWMSGSHSYPFSVYADDPRLPIIYSTIEDRCTAETKLANYDT